MTPDDVAFWNMVGTWASAAGATLAAGAAAWAANRALYIVRQGDSLKPKPKLVITHSTPTAKESDVIVTNEHGQSFPASSVWHRLRVTNENREAALARGVQVMLLSIAQPDAGGDRYTDRWDGEAALQWMETGSSVPARELGPAVECDLCTVVSDPSPRLSLHPMIRSFSGKWDYTEACRLRLTIQPKSIEADGDKVTVDIAWDGKWAANMSNGLVVKLSPASL